MLIKDRSLPSDIVNVMRYKATETPYSGTYNNVTAPGTYLCRSCGRGLFRAHMKFHSSCGWPSFDETIENAVKEQPDVDGSRTEIVCAHCLAHLGHVFDGEGFTENNRRHCVNSCSLDFVDDTEIVITEEAIVAAGCFWGVQYYMDRLSGVLKTEVGYIGGQTANPSYYDVCSGISGHFEAIRVVYDPRKITYSDVIKYFFEIHDPTQKNGQGPDLGPQYRSAVFYYDDKQKEAVEQLIHELTQKNMQIATQLIPVSPFWTAELVHQDYYEKTQHKPYCHSYVKRFD